MSAFAVFAALFALYVSIHLHLKVAAQFRAIQQRRMERQLQRDFDKGIHAAELYAALTDIDGRLARLEKMAAPLSKPLPYPRYKPGYREYTALEVWTVPK